MGIIIDADVVIRGEKGAFDLMQWVLSQPDVHFELAAITVAELWHGVERATGNHREKRLQYLEPLLSAFPVVPYTREIAYEHARIWAVLESSGEMIDDYDIILAATALHNGKAVATFNKRHFSRINGLKVIEPK